MKTAYLVVLIGIFFIILHIATDQNKSNIFSRPINKLGKENTPSRIPTPIPIQTNTTPLGHHSFSDRQDDKPNLYQLHVLYIVTKDFIYTTRDLDGSIDRQAQLVNEWFSEQTNGQNLRFDTYQGKLDITFIVLPVTDAEFLNYVSSNYGRSDITHHGLIYIHYALEDWLEKVNIISPFFSPGKLYVSYFEISHAYVCGEGSVYGSRIISLYPNAFNVRDQNDCKAFLGEIKDNERGVWDYILAHEIIHGLGFPAPCAKNIGKDKVHINDPFEANDIMGSNLGIYDKKPVLDQNHDDYYLTNNGNCPDLANSPFLDPLPINSILPKNVLANRDWRLSK